MTDLDLDAIRARANAATPGPWQWFGNTDVQDIYLATQHWGRQFVMLFARWGMSHAQPVFAADRTWTPNPQSMTDFDIDFTGGGMTRAKDLPVYEVAPDATSRTDPRVYRRDLGGIRNPDATFIAHSRQDVTDLLAEVDRLTGEVEQLRRELDWQTGGRLAAAILTPDDPALPDDPEQACALDRAADLQASLEARERGDAFRVVYRDNEDPYLECDTCGDLATVIDSGDTLGHLHAMAHEHHERYHQPGPAPYSLAAAQEEGYEPDPDPDYGKDLDDEDDGQEVTP